MRRTERRQLHMESMTIKLEDKTPYCKIICGDSREVLKALTTKVDLIITSPPYADARRSIDRSENAETFKPNQTNCLECKRGN
jgi:tRNA1(Val) A37 N6-methylase TrmN6